MKVLIADKFQPAGIEQLESAGCDVIFKPEFDGVGLADGLADHQPDVLVVRSTKVGAEAIAGGTNLSLIVRAGAGYDTIDVATASQRGVFVANCPGKNSIAVAELAWGLILSCDRRIPDQTIELRNQAWNKKEYSKAPGLFGRTLGIVGTGRIGIEVAERGKAFGMRVIGWGRSLDEEQADRLGIGYCRTLRELAGHADVVSIHVAANTETENLIDQDFLEAMRDGAFLINTSRGSVVDSKALSDAIQRKGIRVGLDVFADEPSSGDNRFTDPIVNLPGVVGTHHVGASTDQAQDAIADEAVRIIATYKRSGEVPNCINLASMTPAQYLLTVRHLNVAGVLAHVFQNLGEADINVEEMQNVIYDGAVAACARIQLSARPKDELIEKIREHGKILSVALNRI